MLFDLEKETDRKQYRDYCNELYLWGIETKGVVEIKKRHPQRTLKQNAYLHTILSYFASEFGLDMDTVKHEIFKKKLNPDIFVTKKINSRGKEVKFIKSTASLDKEELALAITRFRNWSAKDAEFYIPSADEHKALIEAEKQIARYAEFLYE